MVVCGARHSPHVGVPTWGFAYLNVSDVRLESVRVYLSIAEAYFNVFDVRLESVRVYLSIAEAYLNVSDVDCVSGKNPQGLVLQ